MQDYYKILGVARDASTAEIQAAYEKKTDYYRSEAFTGSRRDAKEKLREVSGAYNMVGDYCERIKYDKVLERMERFEKERSSSSGQTAAQAKSGPNMLWIPVFLVLLALTAALCGFLRMW